MFELVLLTAIGLVLCRVAADDWLNPFTLYSCTWAPLACYAWYFDLLGNGGITQRVSDVLLVVGASVLAGTILAVVFRWTVPLVTSGKDLKRLVVDELTLMRIHLISSTLLVLYGMFEVGRSWALVSAAGGFSQIFGGTSASGSDFRNQQLAEHIKNSGDAFSGGSALVGLIGYILFLGNVSVFTGALLWRTGKRVVALVPLLVTAVYGLLTLQRTSLVIAVLLFVVSIWLFRRTRVESSGSRKGSPARTFVIFGWSAAVFYLALVLPLQIRNRGTGNATGLQSIENYLFSGFAGLGVRPEISASSLPSGSSAIGHSGPLPGLGAYTFEGVYRILRRAGIDVPTAPSFSDYRTTRIGENIVESNTATGASDWWFDFGFIGLIVIPGLIALIGMLLLVRIRAGSWYMVPVCAFFFTSTLWSFYGNTLLSDARYPVMVAGASVIFKALTGYRVSQSRSSRAVAKGAAVV
ncbi:oligosaccharide repeat unit polymerase [Williamsia muralis]|uniref:O-antigen polymerase n=1 Tax=Williamsia marianensis TaxID=85044 RepID=UPI003F170C7E